MANRACRRLDWAMAAPDEPEVPDDAQLVARFLDLWQKQASAGVLAAPVTDWLGSWFGLIDGFARAAMVGVEKRDDANVPAPSTAAPSKPAATGTAPVDRERNIAGLASGAAGGAAGVAAVAAKPGRSRRGAGRGPAKSRPRRAPSGTAPRS